MKKITSIILLFSLFSLSAFVFAAENPPTTQEQCANWNIDSQQAIKFSKIIQTLIKKDMKNDLAQLAKYPVHINKKNKNGTISRFDVQNKQQFIKKYTSIITRKTKQHILDVNTATGIICNAQGVGFLNGWLWSRTGDTKSFDTINVW